MKTIPGQVLSPSADSDGISTYKFKNNIYSSFVGELQINQGMYFISTSQNSSPYHIIKKRRKDSVLINHQWVRCKGIRIGDIVYYDGNEVVKMEY
jgi:hypothetical protein